MPRPTHQGDVLNELFKGLDTQNAKLAEADLMFFGTAFVMEDASGKKRRIAPVDVLRVD